MSPRYRFIGSASEPTMRHAWRILAALLMALVASPVSAQGQDQNFLGREDIRLFGAGLRVLPARQTVPKDIASIVSTFLQAPTQPDALAPFPPDAIVTGVLRGPGFAQPIAISTRPNTPFNLPPFSVAGIYTLDSIRLEVAGEVVLYGIPESVTIEVIEKLLVTQVTARALTAQEIRDAGIVFDRSNFQAYNFTAAFAIGSANPVPLSFPVVLPRLDSAPDIAPDAAALEALSPPSLPRLETIIPDTLRLQTQVPNLSVVGFTLRVPQLESQQLMLPPIPGVIVIPGDIGFLNQFFNVTLLVGNVAPPGSNLVVSDLEAEILLPAGRDRVPNSDDDPLAMARTAAGESPRVRLVAQAGIDGKLGTGDDIVSLAPGETGSAEYLVEGRREGTHVLEMQMKGTLTGLPVGPVEVTGRAAGSVLVRNPTFTLTFTHPELVNAGEAYTLDVTVTNTSESPANFVSVNLHPSNITGATLIGSPTRDVESIAPGDAVTVSFDLVAQMTGPIVAATLDSDDNINGRFALKTSVGELGIPLSPDSLVLPKEASSLPPELRSAALGLLGRAWAVATAPAAALPEGVTRFSKKIVYDRAIELAEAGFRHSLGEPLVDAAFHLALDYSGNNVTRIAEDAATPQQAALDEADARGFDELRRRSMRGVTFAGAVGRILGADLRAVGTPAFHQRRAEATAWRPAQVSVVIAGEGGAAPYQAVLVDGLNRQLGTRLDNGAIAKEIPFADFMPLTGEDGAPVGDFFLVASPEPGEFVVHLSPRAPPSAALYTVSVVLPAAQGAPLRQLTFTGLTVGTIPADIEEGNIRIRFELTGTQAPTAPPSSNQLVADPPPAVLGVIQPLQADLIPCSELTVSAGRIVAVLFSKEVTRESVQDGATRGLITAFAPEANEAVGVALQPGRRVAMVALRDPFGPLVLRTMSISGARDRAGNIMTPVTVPMVATTDAEGGIVSGTVLNADGTPVAGAEVRLFTDLGPNCQPGVSRKNADDQGRFSWDFVLLRPSRVVAIDPRNGDGRGVNFELQRAGQRLEVNVVFLGRGTIAGRTLDEDGTPLPQTSLKVTSLTDYSSHGAVSGADGSFSVSGVPVGNAIVEAVNTVVRAETTISQFIATAGSVVMRDILLIRDDRRPPTVTFGSAHGVVLRGDGLTPAANVPVIAYYRSNSQAGVPCPPAPPGDQPSPAPLGECALAVVTADANGAFRFERLVSGQFRLESFDQTTYQQGEARAIVPADAPAAANIVLGLGLGTVRGVVLDPAGQRVANARVGGGLSIVTTDANGLFTLTDVPIGRRTIVAVSDALGTDGSTVVDLLRAGDEANATITLAAVAGVSGLVTRADGSPARRMRVYIFHPVGDGVQVIASTETGDDGRYSVSGLRLRADYRLSSFVPSFTEGNIVPIALRFGGEVARVDIRYRGQGTVQGVVLGAAENGADGTPLAAAVGISGEQLEIAGGLVGTNFRPVTNFAVTNTDFTTGRFAFRNIWVGGFTLRAVGAFSPDPIAVEGRVEQPAQVVEMRLQLQPTSRVTGRVVRPDGVTPAGRNIQVVLKAKLSCIIVGDTCIPQGVQRYDAITDDDGRFDLPVVGARRFTLTATDPATGRLGTVDGDVRAGATADFDVRLLAQPTVTVRVFSSDAVTRIAGARVEVKQDVRREEDDSFFTRSGIANGNGEFTLVGPNAPVEGEFTVLATDIAGNGFSGRAAGLIRQQDDGRTVTLDIYLFDQAGTVIGTVFRPDGFTPVPNAEVVVSNESGALAFAVSDALGNYRVETIPLGPFSVDVFEAATARRGFAQGEIDLAGREITINVTEFGVGTVTGQLLQTANLAPLKGWMVRMTTMLPSQRTVQLTTTSDVDGFFLFPGVSEGPFRLFAQRRGFPSSPLVLGEIEAEGQVLDLPIVVDIPRPQFGRIEGTVLLPDGSRAANARVDLIGPGVPLNTATTADGVGQFGFDNIPLGRFTVIASSPIALPQKAYRDAELLFEHDVARVLLVLAGSATITGTVFQDDGVTPSAFAQVALLGPRYEACEGGNVCFNAADANGRFAFTGIPAGSFSVLATAVSGETAQAGREVSPGEVLDVRLVLSPSTAVKGRVLSAAGAPVANAVAELRLSPDDRLFVAANAAGLFEFPAVKPGGPFILTITDPLGDGIGTRNVFVAATAVDLGDLVLDEAPPTLTTAPPPLSTGVPLDGTVRLIFSEPVNPGSVNAGNVILSGPAAAIPLVITMEPGDSAALVRPVGGLAERTRYTLLVRNVADRFGKVMLPFATTFTAVDLTPPSLVQVTPAAGSSGAPVTSVIRAQFDEPIDPARFAGPAVVVLHGGQSVNGRTDFALGNTVVTFAPAFPLLEDTTYELRIAAASDTSGNAQASPLITTFSTTDRTPPAVTALIAANGGRVIENTVIDIAAETSAAHDVAFVDFFVSGVLTFTDRQSPFAFPFLAAPTVGGPGARVTITALATDTSGNRGLTPATAHVDIVADAAPSITITSPADGFAARNNERITLTVTASDDVGLTQVGYRALTGRPQDASTVALPAPPVGTTQTFGFNMPADAAPGSQVPVTATVRDTHGHIVTTTINLVVLDAVGPVVAITGTKSGARVAPGEQAQVIVHATDAGAVRSVSLQASGAALLNETRVIDPALNDVATAFTIVVPPTAQPGQTITLQSTAVDAAGNIGIAPALALSVADRNPPTLTLMTSTGRNEIVPGTPVRIIAAAEDEVGVARIAIQGDGAMAFADARSFSPALGSASTEFIVNVPAAIAEGAVLSITAHAVDLFGNTSDPVTLLLEARTLAAVTAPSTIVIAGETVNVPVTLGSPAPAGGLVLTFTSRAPAVVTSDGNIAIPAGATEGVVRVSGLTGGVTQIDISTAGVPRGSFTTTVRGGVVRGLVTGPNGAVAGAAVSVQVGIDLISTVTDSNGQYFVEGLVRGQVADVSAADPGGELIGFSRGLMSAVGGFANVNVVLAAGARVAGQVTRADGAPVGEGVRVEIFDDRLQSAGIVFTDEDSRYAFPFLELGAYHVDASDTNGNRGRVPVTLTFSGQAITADIRYLGRGTVTGTVRAGGNPVANAEVVLRASSIFGPAAEVVTNAGPDGVYVVDDVFVGTFTVQAIDPVSDRAGFATGSLLVDGELVTRDVAVQAYGTLAGRVLRGDGITPVPGARVILTGSAQTETVADVDGAFQFQFLPLGSYTITAHDVATEQPHFNPAVRLASTVMGRNTATLNVSGATVTRDVQLLPIGSIVATVLDDGGQPVADAKVFVTTRNGALEQTRSGSTNQSGIAVIGSVINGAYSARANTLLLASDPVTGTIAADEIEQVTLTLAPTGSIAGVLTEPDGFTPAAGSVVLDPAVIPNARMTVNADGSWRFDGIRFYSRYTIHAYDAAGRRRGVAREIDINVANEVEQRNISLIGIGAIAGRVVNLDGSGVPNVAVVVQSFTSEFGGAQQTFTDAAGFYSLPDVVAGAFRVSVEDTTRQLAAEAFGEIPALGGNVTLDLALVPNSLQLPTFLYDANGRFYQIPQSGGDPQSGGFSLDVTLDGTTTPFSGAAFGTREDAGREIATREVMGPLQITRKVYVPQGYFARHLEQFTNLGAAPVAVTVALTNRVTQFIGGAGARLTSSGDEQFAAGPERDRWIIVRQGPDANLVTGVDGTTFAWAFDGEGGANQAALLSAEAPSGGASDVRGEWTLTLQPGQTASLLHFFTRIHSGAAGLASAERLSQLPPEALAGLSPSELASIVNFAVPEGGVSPLEALPPIGGTVRGRVFEGDGVTPMPNTALLVGESLNVVRFRSNVIFYGRTQRAFLSNATGEFTFATNLVESSTSVAIPIAPFTLDVEHMWSRVLSPPVPGDFPAGDTHASQNVVFSNTGIVAGTVRRFDGSPITTPGTTIVAQRTVPPSPILRLSNIPVANDGTYRVFGLPEAPFAFSVSVPHPNGSANTGVAAATSVPGAVTPLDLVLEGTGTLQGTLRNATGQLVPNHIVRLTRAGDETGFTRNAVTDTAGVFTFSDVPAGNCVVSAVDAATGRTASAPAVITLDQTTSQDLAFIAVGGVNGTLLTSGGQAVSGVLVQIYQGTLGAPTFTRTAFTDASGTFAFANLLPGNYVLTAVDQLSGLRASLAITIVANATITQDLTLPATGGMTGTLSRSDGSVVSSATVELIQGTIASPTFRRTVTTNASGVFLFDNVPPGDYTLTSVDSANGVRTSVAVTVVANQTITRNLTYSSTGAFEVTVVLSDGANTPLAGAQVASRLAGVGSFVVRGQTDGFGRFTILNQAPGTHEIRIAHPRNIARNRVTTQVSLAAGEVKPVNVALPPVATLDVTAVDADGEPVASAYVWVNFGGDAGGFAEGFTNATGHVTLEGVFGQYRVTAQHPLDEQFAFPVNVSGSVTTENVIIPVEVRFGRLTTLSGVISRVDNAPLGSSEVLVEGGTLRLSVFPDNDGEYSATVLAGRTYRLTAFDFDNNEAGIATITIPGEASTAALDIVLDDAMLPATLVDGAGHAIVIGADGAIGDDLVDNELLNARSAMQSSTGALEQWAAEYSMNRRQLTLVGSVDPNSGLHQERRVYVPDNDTFVRFLDVFENRGTTPVTFSTSLLGLLGPAAPVLATSSGDAALTTADRWLIQGGFGRHFTQLFAGAGGRGPDAVNGQFFIFERWSTLTLQPGERVAFLHFAGEYGTVEDAQLAAERLSALPPEALTGLSASDRALIVNFVVPQ